MEINTSPHQPDPNERDYWDVMAEQFQHQQSPLRPCAHDVQIYESIIADWKSQHPSSETNTLLFGVTPEIARLAWPVDTRLLAIEKSQPMIQRIWPGDVADHRRAVCQNWFDAVLPAHSIDVAIGDGVLTSMKFPDQYAQFAERVSRSLKPEGILILRVFTRPAERESLNSILADLKAARIPRFDVLKWRLAMMLQENIFQGVALDEVFRAWTEIERELPSFIACWPQLTKDTIKFYAGRSQRYTFPTLAELDQAFAGNFRRVTTVMPTYDLGERCPIVVYRAGN